MSFKEVHNVCLILYLLFLFFSFLKKNCCNVVILSDNLFLVAIYALRFIFLVVQRPSTPLFLSKLYGVNIVDTCICLNLRDVSNIQKCHVSLNLNRCIWFPFRVAFVCVGVGGCVCGGNL